MAGEIFVVGVSFRSAPLEVRERLAFPDDQIAGALGHVASLPSVGEGLIISTCNRVEIFGASRARVGAALSAAAEVRRFLGESRQLDDELLQRHVYEYTGEDAVRHVFRVAASLDSLVVGEAQILGQVKSAYGAASQVGVVGAVLGRCLERAFGVAKRVRTETGITRGGANVSSVAVELASQIFGDLNGKKVLLIGAGKMSRLASRHLRASGAAEILVTNRSFERAQTLAAEVEGEARLFEELPELLARVDIVISSTGSPVPIITKTSMKSVMKARRHRTLFLIDIAVPRDIEPAVGDIDGVYRFDVDDLKEVVAENLKARHKEASAAETIVEDEVQAFTQWLRTQNVVPTIRDLRERFQSVARAEVEKALRAAGPSGDDPQAMARLADAIVNKLLHQPLVTLRRGDPREIELLVTATRRLFDLGEAQSSQTEAAPSPLATQPPTTATDPENP